MHAGEDDLRAAGAGDPAGLLHRLRQRARDRFAAHGRDDAVRTVVITAVLNLEESPRMQPGPVERQAVPQVVFFDAAVHLEARRGPVQPFGDEARQPVF